MGKGGKGRVENVQVLGQTVETVLGIRDGIQLHCSFHTDVNEVEYTEESSDDHLHTSGPREGHEKLGGGRCLSSVCVLHTQVSLFVKKKSKETPGFVCVCVCVRWWVVPSLVKEHVVSLVKLHGGTKTYRNKDSDTHKYQ